MLVTVNFKCHVPYPGPVECCFKKLLLPTARLLRGVQFVVSWDRRLHGYVGISMLLIYLSN